MVASNNVPYQGFLQRSSCECFAYMLLAPNFTPSLPACWTSAQSLSYVFWAILTSQQSSSQVKCALDLYIEFWQIMAQCLQLPK